MRHAVLSAAMLLAVLLACQPYARAEVMDEPTRLHEFADGLFVRAIYDIAAKEYEHLLEKFPNYRRREEVTFRLAECKFLLDSWAEAAPLYEKLIATSESPDYVLASRLRLGSSRYYLKDYEKAKAALTPLLADGTPAHYRLGANYFLGRIALAADDAVSATKHFEVASSSGDYAALSAHARAGIAEGEKDYATAVKYYELVIKLAPGTRVAYFSRLAMADVLVKQGNNAAAQQVLKPLADLDTEFPSFEAAKRLALIYLSTEREKDALALLKAMLARFPASALAGEANVLAGRSCMALALWAEAASHYSMALSNKLPKTTKIEAEEGYLRARYELHEYAKITEYAGLIDEDPPARFQSWLLVAEAHELTGNRKAALAIYNRLYTGGPEPLLEYARARRLLVISALGMNEELVKQALSFAQTYPNSDSAPNILTKAGDAAMLLKKHSVAVDIFTSALERKAIANDEPLAVYVRYRRGVARYFTDDKSGMAADLKEIVNSPHAAMFLDKVLMLLGDYEQDKGDYPMAVAYFTRLLDEVPGSQSELAARVRLGSCYYSREMYDKSADIYMGLVKDGHVAALQADMILWCIQYLGESGRLDDAAQMCALVAEKLADPAVVSEAKYRLADVFERGGSYAKAVAQYRVFIAGYPQSPRRYAAKLGLARCLRREGDVDEARRLLHDLIRETVSVMKSTCTLELAGLEFAQNEFDAALREYLMVAILENDESLAAPALIGAVRCCVKLERKADSRKYAQELIKRYPNSPYRAEAEKVLEP